MSVAGSDRATRTSTRAGPSKPVSKAKQKKTKTPSEEEESDDFTAAVRAEGVEDDEILEVEPPRNRKPASRSANGKSAAKGKGKAKADTAPVRRPPSRADIEVVEDTDEAGASGMARAINDATINNRATKLSGRAESSSVTAKQLDRLRRQLESAQNQIHDLSKQLEESYRVRHTEPEDLQQRQVEKYEEIIHTKDLLIKQQEEMLYQKEPLSKEGKSSVLHLITREAADAEKHSAEEQVAYWKGVADAKDRQIVEMDQRIAELKQIQSDLQYEIKTERENSQKAARNPPSALRGRGPHALLGSDDPKHSELVRFYEDVTNLLVTDIKMQAPKYFNLEEWSFTCVYTYTDKSGSEESKRSLGFLLRFSYDPIDSSTVVESQNDLDKAAQYTPLDLDKESPEFAEALQFLGNGFTFPRKQLPLFFNTLVENMKLACEHDQSEAEQGSNPGDESMDSVQLVE